jgi:GntR family transcriptional regulator
VQIVLSNTSGIPLYEQITTQLRTAILTGSLPEGTQLTSLRQLARDLGVSLITTTRAYNDLAAAGLVTNVPGKGSYVLPVDRDQARAEAITVLRTQLSRAASTAATAGIEPDAVHRLLDEAWNEHHHD